MSLDDLMPTSPEMSAADALSAPETITAVLTEENGYLSRLEETISRARGALVDVQYALERVSDGDGMDTVAKMLLDLNTIRNTHRARAGMRFTVTRT